VGAPTHPAFASRFAQGDVHVLRVGEDADGGPTFYPGI
jgi:hypothetical protein